MNLKFSMLACLAILGTSTIADAQQYPPIRKKLLGTGWDKPNTATLRQHLKLIEKAPFDGIILDAIGRNDEGKEVACNNIFSNAAWKKEWFQSAVDDLKAIESAKLTDNFLKLNANPGNVDWFDDEAWKLVLEHWQIAAWIAKEGNMKGIAFDPEPYVHPYRQFDYQRQAQKEKYTFAEYEAKARQRGREVISVIASVDPQLVFMTFFMNSVNMAAVHSPQPEKTLISAEYGLYPAFINGWLDVAPPEMIFVDGSEIQAYRANSKVDYLQTADWIRNATQVLVAPENRYKYQAQVQASFGFYLDSYVNPPNPSYYIDPKGVTRAERLLSNMKFALASANEYVWVYGEKYRWWPTPLKNVNPQNWEDVLPGVNNALLGASNPQLVIQQKISELKQQNKLVNLLRNGDFARENAQQKPVVDAAADWKATSVANWSTWQVGSNGTFTLDEQVNFDASQGGAARIANVETGCFIQSVNVKPGEMYIVQTQAKQVGQGDVWIRIGWQTAAGKWTDQTSSEDVYPPIIAKNNAWQSIQSLVTVPEGAEKLVVLLYAGNQPTAQDVVWFDETRILRVSG